MISTVFRTIVVYVVVIFAMRLMGKRQLGELQPAELVTTFLISNVASICIEEPDLPLLASLVPILLIASMEILNSTAAWYCPHYAQLLFGKPITVIRDGEIDQNALHHLRITAADLSEALRGKDIFTPQDVVWGVVEPNGSFSAAPMPEKGEDPPMLPLLIDRIIYQDNLNAFGLNEKQLMEMLEKEGVTLPQVLILLYNGQESLLIQKKTALNGRP